MRHAVLAALLTALVAGPIGIAPTRAEAADFDPSGRTRKKPKGKPKGGLPGSRPGKPPASAKPPDAPGPRPTPEAADPAGKGPTNDALIARYTGIALAQPGVAFPLQRLAQLHRERDGNLAKLVADLERRAAETSPEAWSARIALAGVQKLDGRPSDAIRTYEAAIAERPNEAAPRLALANLALDAGDKSAARAGFEAALPLLKEGADIEQTTRTLLGLSLDAGDLPGARKHHEALVRRAQGSVYVKGELARELAARNQLGPAEEEFRVLVRASEGDNRALAPALRDLGAVLAKAKKTDEAATTLRRALAVAGGSAGIRAEILALLVEAYRADGRLGELVTLLEKEGGDASRHRTLAGLYEETGAVDKAIAAYRKALGAQAGDVDTRVRLVHLLETAGDLEGAIREYEALIRAAPARPEFVFQLCESLLARGERAKALSTLEGLERRTNEGEVLATLADFYERIDEKPKALALLQRLAGATGGDPTFLVDLGDRYFQAGDRKRALETWARLRSLGLPRAKAALTLGEVYLDHDLADEALAALREAVAADPKGVPAQKALAGALERSASGARDAQARLTEAAAIWEQLVANAGTDANLAREGRGRLVAIWAVTKELPAKVPILRARFVGPPRDLEAGRLLAEVQRKLGKLDEAEATIRAIVADAPGDEASLLALERLLVQGRRLEAAIDILERLAKLNDKAARQYYQRMAQYAAELYRDEDAIRFATRAVELSPDDASGHQKLGDMHRKRQDVPRAIQSYRQAIAKNDRLFPVYFELAELLLATGELDEADRLLRRVVRSAGDDELVSRAARASMQLHLGRGTLVELERDLLPVTIGNPQKPLYRRLLVELYGALTAPLVQTATNAIDPGRAEAARKELAAIGARGVKPLLDALSDEREAQQRIAVEVLAHVANPAAGPTLFNFATGQADRALRTRAMIAVGAIADRTIVPKLAGLLAPNDREAAVTPWDDVALAATWALARTGGKPAETVLESLAGTGSPEVRAMAIVGLGRVAGSAYAERLVAWVADAGSAPLVRAAAAQVVAAKLRAGELAPSPSLHAVVESRRAEPDPTVRNAVLAIGAELARLDAPRGELGARVRSALADAIVTGSPTDQEAALVAAASLVRSPTKGAPSGPSPASARLAPPSGKLDVRDVLRELAPPVLTAGAQLALLGTFESSLVEAIERALVRGPEVATRVAERLVAGEVLPPFDRADATDSERATGRAVTLRIRRALAPRFAELVDHPDARLRVHAARVVAASGSAATVSTIAAIATGEDEELALAMLGAVSESSDPEIALALADTSARARGWSVRARALATIERLGASGLADAVRERIAAKLASCAESDDFAVVREAALRALVATAGAAARDTLSHAKNADAEPHVRAVAASLLDTLGADR